MVDNAQVKPIRKRAANTKSRAGCLTCKKRRVKCDESRPICNRCLKFGVDCDGYRDHQKEKRVEVGQRKPLVPKQPPVSSSLPTNFFTNEQEYYCFQFFCDKTAARLSGYFDSSLWSRLVPQACESNPALRHAVVAIGALDFLSEISPTTPFSSIDGWAAFHKQDAEAQKHHFFALQEYGAAIRHMRNSTSGKKVDIRTTVLGCIVFACFESYHRNYGSAIAQIQTGLALMEKWQIENTENQSKVLELSSHSSYTIEDDLQQAMCRLDIQVMSFVDVRSRQTHDRMRHYGSASLKSLPTRFSNLNEARSYLELSMRRVQHFRGSLSKNKDYNGCLRIQFTYLLPREGACEDQKMLDQELDRWHESFLPLWEYTHSPYGKHSLNKAVVLKIQYLISKFVINAIPLDPSRARAFAMTSTAICKEILSLTEPLLKNDDIQTVDSRFSFDFGVLTALYIIGMCCRDMHTRRRAIALLQSCGRREGLWDSSLGAKALSWIEDIKWESVPEQKFILPNGVMDMKYDFDAHGKGVQIRCLQLEKGMEKPVERMITIN